MEVRAITKYVRISPSKANEVARLIRGMNASEALDSLRFMPRKAARIIRKTLQSAVANAETNAQLDVDALWVKTADVGGGPLIKRWLAVARGSAHPIIKRTSHIRIVLSDDEAERKPGRKPRKTAAGRRKPKTTQPAPAKAAAKPEESKPETATPAAEGETKA